MTADRQSSISALFREAILREGFPCVGARSSVRRELCRIRVYDELGAADSARAGCGDLADFARDLPEAGFAAFVAAFTGPPVTSEAHFEDLLWRHLQHLHDFDIRSFPWDSETSPDPMDPWFSFSIGGHAYYVVGLHPLASRMARQFFWPTLVFNPHTQFTRLREQGLLDSFKRRIRSRDIAVQGSVNPMLLDAASGSQARQYSGRAVAPDWQCPFRPKSE
ncbi:guanitoxin biosynthesis heme-dependent pre-guanitoxin N-hydroxylase GntA [Nocardia sp. NPDC051052]|uniref:guanitoxin biosynthesis heme-dependent pre-guanitoxin N-hydroxylase GntA n=1 Tax=Nocardia sp. NPDC051052 TaxID=3364322 RepID=UPI0037983760